MVRINTQHKTMKHLLLEEIDKDKVKKIKTSFGLVNDSDAIRMAIRNFKVKVTK